MKRKEFVIVFFIFLGLAALFFYKTFLQELVPFPGDLLIAEYNPWKTHSYLGYVPGSYPNKAQYFDVLRQLYPWKTFALESLESFQIPLWNPYSFSGAPLLANFQSAVFYPLNIVYLFLDQINAWSLLVILQPLFSLSFTYFYARKIGLSKLGSLFSSIAFAFSSFVTVWLEYNTIGQVVLWLPLSLLAIEYLLGKKNLKWSLIFVFSIFAAILAGHIQIFAYSLIFLIFYILTRVPKKDFIFFGILIILSLGFGAFQLIPGLELIMNSARSAHPYDFLISKILIQPYQLIMFFVPDFFGNPATRNYFLTDTYVGKVTSIGLVSVFLILISFLGKKGRLQKLFLWTCVVVLILATRNPLTEFVYKFNIPFVSGSAPTLSIFLFCFGASILTGFGTDTFLKEKFNFKKYLVVISPTIILLLILIPVVLIFVHSGVSLRNLYYAFFLAILASVLFLIAIFKPKLRYAVFILLLLINIFDLWRSFVKFNPFSPKETVFPKTQILTFLQKNSGINRFWGYGTANIEANFATQYSLFSPDGYDPMYPKRYGEFVQSSKDGKIATNFSDQTRSDAVIFNDFGETFLSSNQYRLKVLDLLGVRYVLDRAENASTQETFPPSRFKLIYSDSGWKVFENLKALPRIFLTSDYKVFKTNQEFEKIFFDKNFDPLKTILLEKNPSLNNLTIKQSNNSRVDLLEYHLNRIIVNASAESSSLLFLSDTYYPGWKAYVDGKETEILRANYAFRATVVPTGNHQIKFLYDPQSFKLGYAVSLLSLGSLVILLAVKKNQRNI